MFAQKKIIASLLLIVSLIPNSSAFATTAFQDAVNSVQATDPSLPSGVTNPKGSIGYLLGQLFWGAGDGVKNGLIKPQYLDYTGISTWTQSGASTYLTSTTGSVGIGTTNPGAKLEVAGDISLSSGNYLNLSLTSGNTSIRRNGGANGMEFFANAISRMFIGDGGNVGIGTTAPWSKLDIRTVAQWTEGVHIAHPSGNFLDLRPNMAGGNNNPLVQTGDAGIIFSSGTVNGGAFVIAPWSTALGGIRVTNSGNVGIGTITPAQKLDVAGNILLSSGGGQVEFNSGGPRLKVTGANTLGFFNGGNDVTSHVMTISSSANVGIGTTTPGTKLDVNGDVRATHGTFTDGSPLIMASAGANILIDDAGQKRISWNDGAGNFNLRGGNYYTGTGVAYIKGASDSNGGAATITMASDSTDGAITLLTAPIGVPGSAVSYSNSLTIAATNSYFSSNNVGIGTTAPKSRLDVYGNTTSGAANFYFWGSDQTAWNETRFYLSPIAGVNQQKIALISEASNSWGRGKLHFALNGANDSSDATKSNAVMTLTDNGNVGIGITNPSYKLDVTGSGHYAGNLTVDGTFNGILTSSLSAANISAGQFGANTGGGNYSFPSNIGIGTVAPLSKLDVYGGIIGGNQGNQLQHIRLSSGDGTNSDMLEITNTRTATGTNWNGVGYRIQSKVDSTWQGYMQFNGGNNYGISFGVWGSTTTPLTTEAMRIDQNGSIGIGTISPSERLHVSGGNILLDNNYYLKQKNSAGTAVNVLGMDTGNTVRLYSPGTLHLNPDAATNNTFINYNNGGYVQIGNGLTVSNFYVASGNVGIGTTNPSDKLSVSGNVSVTGKLPANVWWSVIGFGVSGSGSVNQGIIGHQGSHELDMFWNFQRNSTAYNPLYANGYTSANGIRMGDSGIQFIGTPTMGTTLPSTNVIITNSGNVGIGTTSPTQKLDVAGTVKASYFQWDGSGLTALNPANISAGTGNINITGNAATVPWSGLSGKPTTIWGLLGVDSVGANPNVRLNSGFYQNSVTTTANGWPEDGTWWHLLSSTHSNAANYFAMQFAADFYTNKLYYRSTNGSGNTAWVRIIDSSNVGTYAQAPLTGITTNYVPRWNGSTLANGVIYDNATNIGIGTTTPGTKLAVWWDLSIAPTSAYYWNGYYNGGFKYSANGYASFIGQDNTNGGMSFWTAPNNASGNGAAATLTQRMGITLAGNVGIGTASPSARLHLYSPTTSTIEIIESTASGTSAQLNLKSATDGYPHILFTQGSTSRFEIGKTANNGNFYFNNNIQSGQAGAAMVISPTGNVGIGTINPGATLQVIGTSLLSRSALDVPSRISGDNGYNRYIRFETGLSPRWDVGSSNTPEAGSNVGSNFYINRFNDSGAYVDTALQISRATGNVSIGTTNPGAKLDVSGGGIMLSSNNNSLAFTDTGGSHPIFSMQSDNNFVFYTTSSGGVFQPIWSTYARNTGNPQFSVSAAGGMTVSGNVGIGTAVPSEKLEVNGNVKAVSFLYTSDRRLKDNIVELTGSLDKISSLNGYTYTWKRDGKSDMGVIAQEVETVYPDMVHTDATTGMKSVEYANMIAPLIESVKELKSISDEQKQEIKKLREEIQSLKARK